jgi:DNA repair ATPase RecN
VIRSVHIKNFRCLRDVKLELEPLTVLVGPNASGKSAILRALQPGGWAGTDCWQHEPSAAVSMCFEFTDGRVAERPKAQPGYTYQRLELG